MVPVHYAWMKSPVGDLLLVGDDSGLRQVNFGSGRRALRPHAAWHQDDAPLLEVMRQLDGYFRGDRREFDLALSPRGTDFQLKVWRALERIPYGATCSYGDIARQIDEPGAARAVGLANGQNPIPIIIPCHRVIGANGSLTGYGGGLQIKRQLLDLESGALSLFS